MRRRKRRSEKLIARRRAASGPKQENPAPPAVVVRRSKIAGKGGYAGRAFKKGERVIEYEGERISNRFDW